MKASLLLTGLVAMASGNLLAMPNQGLAAVTRLQLQPLESVLTQATEAKLAVGDLEGNMRSCIVAAVGRTVWVFDSEGGLQYQEVFANRIADVATGDVNGDGRDEVVVLSGDWLADRSLARVIGCRPSEGRAEPWAHIVVWTSPDLPFAQSISCVRLFGRTLIAVGGRFQVSFLDHAEAGYAELRAKRVDLRELVPEGRRHDTHPEVVLFGPGIGLVEGVIAFDLSPGNPRLAIAARDTVSDTGGGAIAVLRWEEDKWKVESLMATSFPPERLVAGDLVPGGAPELIATTRSAALLAGGWILYEHRGDGWVERWRHYPAGEAEPNLQVAGIAFAARGRELIIASNMYQQEKFQSAFLDVYEWQEEQQGVARRSRRPFDHRLLALAVVPVRTAGEDTILVLEQAGDGLRLAIPEEARP